MSRAGLPGRTPEEKRLAHLVMRLAPEILRVDLAAAALGAEPDRVIVAGVRARVVEITGDDRATPGDLSVQTMARAELVRALEHTGNPRHPRLDAPAGDGEALVFVVSEGHCMALRAPHAVLGERGVYRGNVSVRVKGPRSARGGTA